MDSVGLSVYKINHLPPPSVVCGPQLTAEAVRIYWYIHAVGTLGQPDLGMFIKKFLMTAWQLSLESLFVSSVFIVINGRLI